VCWKPCTSCWSFHLLREEFLSAPIHSPLSGSPYRSFNRHSLGDGATLDFCPCQHKTYEISSPGALTTTRGRPHYCSVLTFYYVGLWQRSLRDRRHGLGLRERSGLLCGWRGNFFSCRRAGFISVLEQVS
jgi:hypothetical protein